MIGGIGGSRSAGGGVRLAYIGSSGGNGGFAVTVFAASVAVCSLTLAAFSEAFAAVAEVDASPALAV